VEFKDLFAPNEIEKAEDKELLDQTVKTILHLKPVVLNLKEKNELVYKMPTKADFEKVDEFVTFKEDDNALNITVPIYDERNLPEFQVSLFNDSRNDCFPERGFYIVGSSKLITEPLGLVKVEMNGLPYILVGSDYRFEPRGSKNREIGYKRYLYFYYDYQKKLFVKVFPDKLEECKRKMGNEKDPEKKEDILLKYHATVQEYIKREKLLEKIKERIYPLSLPYLKRLKQWKDGDYKGFSIGTITTYVDGYRKFIKEEMIRGLKIKLVYANVTKREYSKLFKQKRELLKLIKNTKRKLEEIKSIQSLTGKNEADYELDANSLFEREREIYNYIEKIVMPELQKFKEVRPTKFPENGLNERIVLKGYIDFDLEKNEVYPNIMQLQRRTSLTEEKEDFRSEDEYTSKILDYFK